MALTVVAPGLPFIPCLLPIPQPGDKIVQISASFGSEVWKAENFGQVNGEDRWGFPVP